MKEEKTRFPLELYLSKTGKAQYIDYPLNEAWKITKESFAAVDSVLKFEKILSDEWTDDRKYSYEKRGRLTMKVYSRDFSKAYSNKLNGMQERRMKATVKSIGSFWYTAWINAGQPDLTELYGKKHESGKLKEINEKEDPENNNKTVQTRLHNN